LLEQNADKFVYTIKDQRDKLRKFISTEISKVPKGVNFDTVYKLVSNEFQNFYTKDFVFKVIDELFQMGLLYEVNKYTYASIDN